MNFRNAFVFCLCIGAAETTVLNNFSDCKRFFYQEQSPSLINPDWNNTKYICQQYKDKYYYATLYDAWNRIPVYSASELLPNAKQDTNHVDDIFFIEPNLAYEEPREGNMIRFQEHLHDLDKNAKFGVNQALNTDYKQDSKLYDRGHLNPQLFNLIYGSKYATNSLTNIAPQWRSFNQETWSRMEKNILKTAREKCNFEGAKIYYVVGVEPSNDVYIMRKIGNKNVNRVNVPKLYWTAFCCDTSLTISIDDRKKGWSLAYSANNIDAKSVTVSFYPVDNFLTDQYSKIFADYKGNDGYTVYGCQFSKNYAKKVITHIIKTIGKVPKFEPNPTERFDK